MSGAMIPVMTDNTEDQPLEQPPSVEEGDDSVNRPEGLKPTTTVDFQTAKEQQEEDVEDESDDG